MHNKAKLSAYYKDSDNTLHKISTVITTDPEGVTEEDVQRLTHEVYKHLNSAAIEDNFTEPVLVCVRGGKA